MVNIVKASGETAEFDANKLRRSLKRVGTNPSIIEKIVTEVKRALKPGMSTHAIYQIAFRLLRKASHTLAAKYHLKQAIMRLGSSGYPFEKYMAALLRYHGYQVENNKFIKGYCVSHEVDVLAKGHGKRIFVECKYHNRSGLRCDVKVALYVKARFQDIDQAYKNKSDHDVLEGWLATNTRFTIDAMQYARCAGLHLVAWDYPKTGNLKELIEFSGLYPISCITNFTKAELGELIENNVILCKSLHEQPDLLESFKIPKIRKESILKQCRELCLPVEKPWII
ncbi:MAG: restriction endonuclease [Gammaproteobacteria bacterium]